MAVALVTGASGFLGRYVCREIRERGDEVVSLTRGSPGGVDSRFVLSSKPTAEEICGVADETGASFIYHLAGTSDSSDIEALYRANVVYAHLVLTGATMARRPPKVVLIGSAAEYGRPISPDNMVREGDVCNPVSAYGISKLAQTLHGLAASASGLQVTVARLFNPIGACSPTSTALGSFVRQLSLMTGAGGVLRTGPLHSIRDFIDVSEAARIIAKLPTMRNAHGEVFNVCTGAGLLLQDVVTQLIETSGLTVKHEVHGHLRGTSDLDTVIGSNEKLSKLGIRVSTPDLKAVLAEMLSSEQARTGML